MVQHHVRAFVHQVVRLTTVRVGGIDYVTLLSPRVSITADQLVWVGDGKLLKCFRA